MRGRWWGLRWRIRRSSERVWPEWRYPRQSGGAAVTLPLSLAAVVAGLLAGSALTSMRPFPSNRKAVPSMATRIRLCKIYWGLCRQGGGRALGAIGGYEACSSRALRVACGPRWDLGRLASRGIAALAGSVKDSRRLRDPQVFDFVDDAGIAQLVEQLICNQ